MSRPNLKKLAKFLVLLGLAVLTLLVLQHVLMLVNNNDEPTTERSQLTWMRNWHDYEAMQQDAKRTGIGEQGKPAELNLGKKEVSLENGYNSLLSDAISVNRSVPDIRHHGCRDKLYRNQLPNVSVIMPFYNELFSVLVRSVHSVVNRTPRLLLKEIILVDDGSDRGYLRSPLKPYVAHHFPIVRILRLRRHTGVVAARLAGARAALSKVLVIMDSHIEVNYNWLPPLLELIAENSRNVVCPFIDIIDEKTFAYSASRGARGAFDWYLNYQRLKLLRKDEVDRTRPFPSPIMAGGLFAISAEFFWDLGGYDEGLQFWGGEQFELSFKIWMCGGQILDVPCSRIGHIFRGWRNGDQAPATAYLFRNYKRVAEVWMDQYKEYLYRRLPKVYDNIDAGNLSKQKALRERLQCKSFDWFIDNIAFDLEEAYPPVEQPFYAYGVIRSGTVKYLYKLLKLMFRLS